MLTATNFYSGPDMPDSTPQPSGAAQYAQQVELLGANSRHDPVATLSYGSHPGQTVQVYVPTARNDLADLPVLLFFHGGAWMQGGLSWLRFMAPAVTSLPAIFVAATYRLAPENRWPTQYEDACTAISYVHQEIERFGGSRDRFIVGGHSAGGHLAALAALKKGTPPLRACLPVSSPLDLRYGNVSLESEEGRVYKYLLADRSQDADASPMAFVEGADLPFHLVWGEQDFARIQRSNSAFSDALRGQSFGASHQIVPGASHFDTHLMLSDRRNPWYDRVATLLEESRA